METELQSGRNDVEKDLNNEVEHRDRAGSTHLRDLFRIFRGHEAGIRVTTAQIMPSRGRIAPSGSDIFIPSLDFP
jgi:hypothetical protein